MSAQTDVGILTSPQLSECVFDWIPLGSRFCVFKLKRKSHYAYWKCMPHCPKAVSKYQVFVDDVNDALQRVKSNKNLQSFWSYTPPCCLLSTNFKT